MLVAFKKRSNIRTDDFTRESYPQGMGSAWGLLPGVSDADMEIVSPGKLRCKTGNTRGDQWRSDFDGGPLINQFGEVRIATWTGTVNRLGAVLLRESSSVDSCYEFSVIHDPGFDHAVIAKVTLGAYVELSNVNYVAQVGDVIRGEVTGSNPTRLVHRINGTVMMDINDSVSPHTSGYPGVATIVIGGPNSDAELDNWSGGELF